MEIDPKYEFFGRQVKFDDIDDIRRVFQPGILDAKTIFDAHSLGKALEHLCGFVPKDIIVYFNEVTAGIASRPSDKLKWWELFRNFASRVKDSPAGCEIEYWYGPSGKAHSSPEFDETKPPYQAFARLFGNALQAFSCFVGEPQIGIRSERNNYHTMKPGEGFVHDMHSMWAGKSDVFLQSAAILEQALRNSERYEERAPYGARRSDIRVIYPGRGALVGSLYGDNSVTLFIAESSLEKMVRLGMELRARALERIAA